jgi:hypothetical protein
MALEEWGTFIASVENPQEAQEMIRQLNVALAKIPLDFEQKMEIEFHWKMRPGMKSQRDRAVYVYMRGLAGEEMPLPFQ